jgi:hypothetical protein
MSSVNSINTRDSDKTFDDEPQRYEKLTESEFLTHEAELAKTAMARTLDELKSGLVKAGDVRLWTQHHPWVALGVAAATGFSLAALLRGGGEDRSEPEAVIAARKQLLEEAAKSPYDGHASRPGPTVSSSLLGSLFNLARTAIEASLLTAIRAEGVERAQAPYPIQATPPRPEPDQETR